jgi:ferric-dicitrate binding protein FerR (iron transport regulator)
VFSKTSLISFRNDNPAVNQSSKNNKIYTRPGSRSKVELPDGSTVWLNSGSTITYEKNFGKNSREVTLSGEGYFDITKKEGLPFYINTDNLIIKVLGTILNVKAYPDDKKTETSLIRGKIEVVIKNRPNNKIILAPREKLIVENIISPGNRNNQLNEVGDKDSHILMSVNKISFNKEDSSFAETGWVKNRLIFRDEPFEDLLRQMERWYNITLVLTNNRLKQQRVSGSFENETINQALDALKFSIPFEYSQTGNKILIY